MTHGIGRAAGAVLLASAISFGCPQAPPPGDTAMDVALDAAQDVIPDVSIDTGPALPVQVRMDFTHAGGFYSAPFPSEDRRLAGDHVDLHDFPPGRGAPMVTQLLSILGRDADGFGLTSLIVFQLTGAIDATGLPDVHASLAATSPLFLVSVDPAAPDYLHRYPVRAQFDVDGGPYGASNLLTLLPYQGIPLRPRTLYAAVVTRALTDTLGRPLDVAASTARLVAGTAPDGLAAAAMTSYGTALTALDAARVDRAQIAGLAVFRTGDPAASTARVRDDALARPTPVPDAPFVRDEVFTEYCVYHSTVAMPVYQAGTPPYNDGGGGWTFDASGHAIVQRQETANFVVTVPRRAMPAAGFPLAVLVRTGAGGDRPLVDRGVQAFHGGPSLVAGSGPAQDFAHAGFAGATVDGPLGGLRNPTGGDEQFLVFNVGNPLALRDNVRQSALELALLAHILEGVRVDASDCPGVTGATGGVRFDTGTLALMGHSMGATIAPLAVALEPRYRALILSGAGGSWVENVMYKRSPVEVRPAIELLLRYNAIHRSLSENDPALSLLQWAGEPADPPVYGRAIVQEPVAGSSPRHVLMVQGIVDTYILPPIANTTSLSFGLDLAGTALDEINPGEAMFTPLGAVLDLSGRHRIAYPAMNNITPPAQPPATAVVVQALEDGIEDGHEVIFQTEGPKHQYICFLQSYAAGAPVVVAPGAEFAVCP